MNNQGPPRWRYALAILIVIVGMAAFSYLLINDIGNLTNSLITVMVPGSSDLNLTEPGKYTISYEYQTIVGGRVYSSDINSPNLYCRLLEKQTRSEVALHLPSIRSTYSINGRSWVSLFDFEINRSGTYELSAWYPEGQVGQQVVLAVGPNTAGGILEIILRGLVIFLGPSLIALLIIVVTYRKRKKTLEQAGNMKIAKLVIEGRGIEELPALIKEKFKTDYQFTSEAVIVLMKEKFYYRINSTLLAVIILNYTSKDSCEVEIIAGGGKKGRLMSTDWGAEGDMRNQIVGFFKELCPSKSWAYTEASP